MLVQLASLLAAQGRHPARVLAVQPKRQADERPQLLAGTHRHGRKAAHPATSAAWTAALVAVTPSRSIASDPTCPKPGCFSSSASQVRCVPRGEGQESRPVRAIAPADGHSTFCDAGPWPAWIIGLPQRPAARVRSQVVAAWPMVVPRAVAGA